MAGKTGKESYLPLISMVLSLSCLFLSLWFVKKTHMPLHELGRQRGDCVDRVVRCPWKHACQEMFHLMANGKG
jgi:hypothetical protein